MLSKVWIRVVVIMAVILSTVIGIGASFYAKHRNK
nr:MAG TPA: hypothetical protein [Caudoviricetes sp.]